MSFYTIGYARVTKDEYVTDKVHSELGENAPLDFIFNGLRPSMNDLGNPGNCPGWDADGVQRSSNNGPTTFPSNFLNLYNTAALWVILFSREAAVRKDFKPAL